MNGLPFVVGKNSGFFPVSLSLVFGTLMWQYGMPLSLKLDMFGSNALSVLCVGTWKRRTVASLALLMFVLCRADIRALLVYIISICYPTGYSYVDCR